MEIKEKLVCAAKNAKDVVDADSTGELLVFKNGEYSFWLRKKIIQQVAFDKLSFLGIPRYKYITETFYKICSPTFGEEQITEQEYNELLDVYNKLKDKKDKENIKKLEELCK